MNSVQPTWFVETLTTLLERRSLSEAAMRQLLEDVMAGRCGEAETAALLIALRMKGETAEEVTAAARVLRERMVRLETGRTDVLDTCGMGGDGSGTFNISTAAAAPQGLRLAADHRFATGSASPRASGKNRWIGRG